MWNIKRAIRIKKTLGVVARNEMNKKTNYVSHFQQSTWLSSCNYRMIRKTIVNASYKVAKVISKKDIPLRIENFLKENIFGKKNCLFLQ